MNDLELLELAARAAGISVQMWEAGDPYRMKESGAMVVWNPLTDDGDALRLAVDLGIHIAFYGDHVAVQQTHTKLITEQRRDGNVRAACRRAIVRAAAEIGKAMQ